MKNNNEVNVNTPGENELQAINPYNFINIYKSGFTYSIKTTGSNYEVHLKATNSKRSIQEMVYLCKQDHLCTVANKDETRQQMEYNKHQRSEKVGTERQHVPLQSQIISQRRDNRPEITEITDITL